MNRSNFLKTSLLAGAGLALAGGNSFSTPKKRNSSNKILNAYYFRAHMYTMIPRHVSEDLKWMADAGTNVVSIAVLEQDLFAAAENIEFICNEAAKLGIEVWAVPSRWGGIVAGAPKVPSIFTCQNPQTWAMNKDGSYINSENSGRISSIFHPDTLEFMCKTSDKVFSTWDLKGIIWDEPKTLIEDYHPLALAQLGNSPTYDDFINANVHFYSQLNKHVKSVNPNKKIALFVYASKPDSVIEACAKIEHLDVYGCDGRPWGEKDGGKLESKGKVLLDGQGEKFIQAAKKNGKQSLWLIENHNMADDDIQLLEKRMPDVVNSNVDHLIYYYYPRNLSQPDKIMNIIRKNLKNFS